jgi:ubiquinone/menaquinone biosynthesis C-methylase UbiE
MSLPDPPSHLDPDLFAEMGARFMNARLLSVAVELGIFEKLADGPRTVDELASETGLPRRSLRVVVNGLAALQVLHKQGDAYVNGEAAQAFLTGRTSVDARPGLRLYNHLIYPMWLGFENAVRTGEPARHGKPSEQFARIFSEGVEAWTGPGARALPQKFDFGPHRRLLDVGGGTGSYLLPILRRYPDVRATLFDLPPAISIAKRRLSGEAERDRIDLVEGDALFDDIPGGHDVVLIAGFVHLFDPDKIRLVLRRVRDAVAPGTPLLIVDQWMDATHTQPVFGAMLAATYLMLSGDGDTYSVEEAQPWLREAGWRFVEHRPLAGVTSLVVSEAR